MSKPYLCFDLDQISEVCDLNARQNIDNIPPILQDSPYLSSPIRPIPSFNHNRSGGSVNASVRQAKKTTRQSNRASSPNHSTVASIPLSSPYSESLFSLQSSPNVKSRRQSTNRTVLLPKEVDELMLSLEQESNARVEECVSSNESRGEGDENMVCRATSEEDDDYYDSSSNSDESNTVTSDCALSLDDAGVSKRIKEMEDEKEVVLFVMDKGKKEKRTPQWDESIGVKMIKKDLNEIKLPPVGPIIPENFVQSNDLSRPKSRKSREDTFDTNAVIPGIGCQLNDAYKPRSRKIREDTLVIDKVNNATKHPRRKQINLMRSSGEPYSKGKFKRRGNKLVPHSNRNKSRL